MATVGTFSKTRLHAAGSPRRHPQLLPHQGTLWSGGSHQRQHQNPSSKGSWLQESRLSAAQGSAHGGHQDRIHRSSESRLKCGPLRILVQNLFFLLRPLRPPPEICAAAKPQDNGRQEFVVIPIVIALVGTVVDPVLLRTS